MGGFAGMDQREEVATETLTADRAAVAARCVEKLFEAGTVADADEPMGADMLQYEIEVENGAGKPRKLSLVDDGSQPALGELLKALDI